MNGLRWWCISGLFVLSPVVSCITLYGVSQVLRWSFIIGLVAVAVSFYCGDIIKNPHQAATPFKGMLPPFRTVSGWR